MNKDTLMTYILNGQPIEEIIASLFWGILGLGLSVLIELIRGSSKIKVNGGFRLGTWISNNSVRLLASILIVVVGSTFGQMVTGEIPIWAACLIGFVTDKVIEALIKVQSSVDITKFFIIFTKRK